MEIQLETKEVLNKEERTKTWEDISGYFDIRGKSIGLECRKENKKE